MADIAQHDLTKTLFSLLKETFEGPGGSVYLDNGAGLFQTLDALTAEAASHVPGPGAQTIAAHCAHLASYVRVNHNYASSSVAIPPAHSYKVGTGLVLIRLLSIDTVATDGPGFDALLCRRIRLLIRHGSFD